jgi:hypothetical protein
MPLGVRGKVRQAGVVYFPLVRLDGALAGRTVSVRPPVVIFVLKARVPGLPRFCGGFALSAVVAHLNPNRVKV